MTSDPIEFYLQSVARFLKPLPKERREAELAGVRAALLAAYEANLTDGMSELEAKGKAARQYPLCDLLARLNVRVPPPSLLNRILRSFLALPPLPDRRDALGLYLRSIDVTLCLLPRRRREEELKEIRQHLSNAIAAKVEEGQGQEDATREALKQFGNPKDVGAAIMASYERRKPLMWLDGMWLFWWVFYFGPTIFGIFGIFTHNARPSSPRDTTHISRDLLLDVAMSVFCGVMLSRTGLQSQRLPLTSLVYLTGIVLYAVVRYRLFTWHDLIAADGIWLFLALHVLLLMACIVSCFLLAYRYWPKKENTPSSVDRKPFPA